MAKSDASVPRKLSGLSVHSRGHFLLFDERSAPLYDASTGARLLLIAVVVEAFRLVVVRWLHPALPLLILVLLLLALRVVVGSFRCAAEAVADRIISVARVASGREVLFCSTPDYREHRFPVGVREPAAAHSGPAFRPLHGVERVRSLPFLRLLSGGGVPRDFAVGTGSPMGSVHRHFDR